METPVIFKSEREYLEEILKYFPEKNPSNTINETLFKLAKEAKRKLNLKMGDCKRCQSKNVLLEEGLCDSCYLSEWEIATF